MASAGMIALAVAAPNKADARWNGWWVPGAVIGGLALGAAIASSHNYYYGYAPYRAYGYGPYAYSYGPYAYRYAPYAYSYAPYAYSYGPYAYRYAPYDYSYGSYAYAGPRYYYRPYRHWTDF